MLPMACRPTLWLKMETIPLQCQPWARWTVRLTHSVVCPFPPPKAEGFQAAWGFLMANTATTKGCCGCGGDMAGARVGARSVHQREGSSHGSPAGPRPECLTSSGGAGWRLSLPPSPQLPVCRKRPCGSDVILNDGFTSQIHPRQPAGQAALPAHLPWHRKGRQGQHAIGHHLTRLWWQPLQLCRPLQWVQDYVPSRNWLGRMQCRLTCCSNPVGWQSIQCFSETLYALPTLPWS